MGKPRFEDRKGWSGINKGASGMAEVGNFLEKS